MKKEWINPNMEELDIAATASGQSKSNVYDGPWVQIGDQWYLPGSGAGSPK